MSTVPVIIIITKPPGTAGQRGEELTDDQIIQNALDGVEGYTKARYNADEVKIKKEHDK
jgi:hypothetical protein